MSAGAARVLYVYCHPLPESFHAVIRAEALAGLREAGHQVDLLDLYAEGFDPVLSADGRRRYHDVGANQQGLEPYVARLKRADILVVQFPTWSFGPPAMLKGFIDRMMMPGVAFDLSDPARAKPLLENIKHVVGIVSYGRPRLMVLGMADPPRKLVTRYLRWFAATARGRHLSPDLSHERRHRRAPRGLSGAGSPRDCRAAPASARPLARPFRAVSAGPASLPSRWWWDLSTREFAALDWDRLVAILPVAAVEQHGPHLPVRVDAAINAGVVDHALALMPPELPALVLPTMPVGKSTEHQRFPGTLSFSFETLARMWIELGESVARAGCRRLLILNSHGGQPQVMEIVTRELRVRLGMLAVGCAWWGLAAFDDLFSDGEWRHGIHGGEVETSAMLHLHPDLVRREHAADFVSLSVALEAAGGLLTPEGPVGFGWAAQDLHPLGVCGNAAAADAERGRILVERAARGLVALTAEVAAFPFERLGERTGFDRD